ncbi:hypothetical protein N9066_00265 [bacterium]|nr:hypothetical protein [bacterium]
MTPTNPFDQEPMHYLWEMCIRRDLEAYLVCDWSIIAPDFEPDGFLGINARSSNNPCDWKLEFPNLNSYKKAFEQQAGEFAEKEFNGNVRNILYNSVSLENFQLTPSNATLVKVFDGELIEKNSQTTYLKWKSMFYLVRRSDVWKISGFVGYLPTE